MNTPPAVAGCQKCGALYTPGPGDRGVCAACRRLLPAQPPPSRSATPKPGTVQPIGAFSNRPGAPQRSSLRGGRGPRRIATVAVVALLVAGGGAAIVMRGGPALSNAWTKARRHTLPDALAAAQRQASEAWIAIRSHLPLDSAPAPTQRPPIRDATASRGTHRRAQPPGAPAKGKALAKRSRDDMNTPGSTP